MGIVKCVARIFKVRILIWGWFDADIPDKFYRDIHFEIALPKGL